MANSLASTVFAQATLADGVAIKNGRPKFPNDGGSIWDSAVSQAIDLADGDFIAILPVPVGARILAAAIIEGPATDSISADDVILVTGTTGSLTETALLDASALSGVSTNATPAAAAGIELRKLYAVAAGEGVKVTAGFGGAEHALLAIHTNANNGSDEYGLAVVYDRGVD